MNPLFLWYGKNRWCGQVMLKYALDLALAVTTYYRYPIQGLLAQDPVIKPCKKLIISFPFITPGIKLPTCLALISLFPVLISPLYNRKAATRVAAFLSIFKPKYKSFYIPFP